MKLESEMLITIEGGALTSTMFNSIARLVSTIVTIGKMLGASLNKIVCKNSK